MNKRMKKLVTASALLSLLVASPIASAATTYTVKSGDNLWKISTQYGTTIAELKAQGERIEIVDGELSEDLVFAAILRLI